MNIVGQSFTPESFADYVQGLDLKQAAPWAKFCVRHNTGSPTLAQRPDGFTHQHMLNLEAYYRDTMKWSAGPHLFIDDHLIWVFSDLRHPGVHTPSWNDCSFGIEQLGDYDQDDYDSGRGLAVQRNAIGAFAVLSHACGIDSHSMRDHYMDPATTHRDCPGKSCRARYVSFMDAVHAYILENLVVGNLVGGATP